MDDLEEIKKLLVGLARGQEEKFGSLIDLAFEDSNSQISGYFTKVDPNGRPRVHELINLIANKITDFAIPRSKINRAAKRFIEEGSTEEITSLALEAKGLFTSLEKSGEGGELLLFALTESVLKYPQILCKMHLKTDEEMHVHGSDGVFLGVDDDKNLCVFWGESKLHSSHSSALADCIDSIEPILKMEAQIECDIRLMDYIDLDNRELEKAICNYFDYTSPEYEKLRYCAICLISFDHTAYSNKPNKNEIIKSKLENDYQSFWKKNLQRKITEKGLDNYKIIFFYLPIPSVSDFRAKFREKLGL
jgi:hypothetical protein